MPGLGHTCGDDTQADEPGKGCACHVRVLKAEEAKDDPGYTEKENGPPGGETGLTPSEYRESKVCFF